MTIYVLAEHDNKLVKPSTFSTITAALQLGDAINVLVVGYDCETVAKQLSHCRGVEKVLLADDQCYAHALAERYTDLIIKIIQEPTYLLAPATTFGKNILPRVAACLDVAQISDIIAIENENTYRRPIYAGNAIEVVKSLDAIQVITVRSTAFEGAPCDESHLAPIHRVDYISDNQQSAFVKADLHTNDRPELTSADIVISGGRGMKNEEGFNRIGAIADRLGAALGASRAAVDAGLAPNDCQVGQTGQVVAPKLYFALGISGAIQHLAGMKDSKIIVAINKDADAPIFQVADYGLVADLNNVLPEWEKILAEMGY